MTRSIVVILGFAAYTLATLPLPASSADATNAMLQGWCAKKTIVMNKQGERVGERMDGQCAGYLRGYWEALRTIAGSDCKDVGDKQPEDLLSVYETYVKEKKVKGSDFASSTLMQAYGRAFDCRTN
jgi:hypothetical protein